MKKLINVLALLFGLTSVAAHAQSYTAQAGVSLFTGSGATATFTTGAVRLPTFSGTGILTVTGAGITGSPSGCTVVLKAQGNNSTVNAAVSTTAFTPSTGVQSFVVSPSQLTADNYVATYACSSTYPTAGTLTASFSPITTVSLDPCDFAPKSFVSVAISTATTTQLVALSAGKKIYVCGFNASFGATTTAQFEYGTGSTCGTGTTALSGVYAPGTGVILSLAGDGSDLATPAGNAFCVVSTGTGGINGTLSYVQQ